MLKLGLSWYKRLNCNILNLLPDAFGGLPLFILLDILQDGSDTPFVSNCVIILILHEVVGISVDRVVRQVHE